MFRTGSSKQNNFILAALGLVAVLLTLTSLFYIFGFDVSRLHPRAGKGSQDLYTKPLPGHWLKTASSGTGTATGPQGEALDPLKESPEGDKNAWQNEIGEDSPAIGRAKVSYRHLNKDLDSTNVLYIWTDKGKLRVVSVMALNRTNKKPAIVVIPLQTVISEEGDSVQEVFLKKGREEIRKLLQGKFEVKLHHYVHIDQEALYGLSEILGTLNLHNEKVTMAQALEESAAGLRTNDETIVREVAKKAVQPSTWLQLPRLVTIFNENINSDFSIGEMLQVLNLTRQLEVENTEKAVLPGEIVFSGGKYRKVVEADTWQNILYEVTR